jgi:hypothetical protein
MTMTTTTVRAVAALSLAAMACSRGPEWKEFTAPDGTFSASFPAPPQSAPSELGMTHRAGFKDVVFIVTVVPLRAEEQAEPSPDRLYDKVQGDIAAQRNLAAEGVQPVTAGTYAGREFLIRFMSEKKGPAVMTFRLFRGKAQLFILNTVAPADGSGVDQAPFWSSFAIRE